jgi:hypothetical protein
LVYQGAAIFFDKQHVVRLGAILVGFTIHSRLAITHISDPSRPVAVSLKILSIRDQEV